MKRETVAERPPAQATRRPKHAQCRCGKRGWTTKFDADQVVVNAKILRHLHHNNRRQEQRSYRCTTNSALWHVTSKEQQHGLRHTPDDDGAAREYIESVLLAELSRDTSRAWERLIAPEYVAQTERVLSVIHQAGLKDGADRKAALARTVKNAAAGGSSPQRLAAERAAYEDWKLHWARFQAALVARKAQARSARRDLNVARSADAAAVNNTRHREVVAKLACAVAEHRANTSDPSLTDEALWSLLDALTVPFQGGQASLSRLIAERIWINDKAEETREPR